MSAHLRLVWSERIAREADVQGPTGLRAGDRVKISYEGVTATGTFISLYDRRFQIRLDGTDQMVMVPAEFVERA